MAEIVEATYTVAKSWPTVNDCLRDTARRLNKSGGAVFTEAAQNAHYPDIRNESEVQTNKKIRSIIFFDMQVSYNDGGAAGARWARPRGGRARPAAA
eukprot:CAMPEP_0113822552 /NCGR_PEP_ID=MMETSP0328-20130328/2298_1 /TAXON_ID=39455 /ORGANISM="Alexandrium minutum" /LENGTH=96 /DNA_ID=CAMNT_0000790489 /DNA_START=59 /DNA_END=347 /DNA_ORIENTATION=- /assembly_acc=CAM_ASM_000350